MQCSTRYLRKLLEIQAIYKHADCMADDRYLGIDDWWLTGVDFEAKGVVQADGQDRDQYDETEN